MGQLRHVLVHRATPVLLTDGAGATWIEGERAAAPTPTRGTAFPCVLFLPLGSEDESQPRSRKITRPTLMWEPVDFDGVALAVPVGADHELLVSAPELAGYFDQAEGEPDGTGRWQVEGSPQPFGPPGRVIGYQATLKQVAES